MIKYKNVKDYNTLFRTESKNHKMITVLGKITPI